MYLKNKVIETPEQLGKSWDTPEINWYPGHMLKAKKELAKQMKRVDVVLEMRDARIPVSSANHDFEKLLQQKNGYCFSIKPIWQMSILPENGKHILKKWTRRPSLLML